MCNRKYDIYVRVQTYNYVIFNNILSNHIKNTNTPIECEYGEKNFYRIRCYYETKNSLLLSLYGEFYVCSEDSIVELGYLYDILYGCNGEKWFNSLE